MGLSIFGKSCYTNPTASAPNPDPSRWVLLDSVQFSNAHVLKVRYLDCTNFEGVKVVVYRGKYRLRHRLDPHFSDSDESPIARFKPDADGWKMAIELAMSIGG